MNDTKTNTTGDHETRLLRADPVYILARAMGLAAGFDSPEIWTVMTKLHKRLCANCRLKIAAHPELVEGNCRLNDGPSRTESVPSGSAAVGPSNPQSEIRNPKSEMGENDQ